jgi:hypothetical protein
VEHLKMVRWNLFLILALSYDSMAWTAAGPTLRKPRGNIDYILKPSFARCRERIFTLPQL